MNQKLKLILLVGFISLLGNLAKAQTKDDEEAKKRILELRKTLNLTPEQVEKVKTIFLESKNTRKSLREKFDKSKNQTNEQKQVILDEMKTFRQEQKLKITQILTEDQIKRFEDMIQIKKLNDSHNIKKTNRLCVFMKMNFLF